MPSHYTGFYVSKKLDKVLISDPQGKVCHVAKSYIVWLNVGLLRNIDRETCNECPVWIKLNVTIFIQTLIFQHPQLISSHKK